jgi:hypothetical protein
MTIVPASRLSASDLALLGNNVRAAALRRPRNRPRRQPRAMLVSAVNRSLAGFGEQIGRLYKPVPVPA